MLYIDKDIPKIPGKKFKEGVQLIIPKEAYYIRDSDVERKYRMVTGEYIIRELEEDEKNGDDYRYINAVSSNTFLLTRYSKPNTGITAVIFGDKLVRNDFDIMSIDQIYGDKSVNVLGVTLAKYYMPIVFEKHKDSMGYSIDVHFCGQHENFVCITSKVSAHFQSIDPKEGEVSLELVFKYDTESGVKERKFGNIRFTSEGIFLAGGYHALYEKEAMKEYMTIDAWKM